MDGRSGGKSIGRADSRAGGQSGWRRVGRSVARRTDGRAVRQSDVGLHILPSVLGLRHKYCVPMLAATAMMLRHYQLMRSLLVTGFTRW